MLLLLFSVLKKEQQALFSILRFNGNGQMLQQKQAGE